MRETINYCGKNEKGIYVDFYKNKKSVSICGHKEIFKVKIIEAINDENNSHWSWWDNQDNEFLYTHYNRLGVTICFPYGIKIEEKQGKGQLLPVKVELIEI